MFVVSIIIFLVAGSFAVSAEPGHCPNVTTVNLSLVGLAGTWYRYASTDDQYDSQQKCFTQYWSYPQNGVSSVVTTTISTRTGNLLRVESEATTSNKNKNTLNIVSHTPRLKETTNQFQELEIIYDSYAISWTCKEDGPNHVNSIAIYTREQNPKVDVMEKARMITAKNGIPVPDLKKYNYEGCH